MRGRGSSWRTPVADEQSNTKNNALATLVPDGEATGFFKGLPQIASTKPKSITAWEKNADNNGLFADNLTIAGVKNKLGSVTFIQYFVVKKGDKMVPIKDSAFKITKQLKKEGDKYFLVITRTALSEYKTPDGFSIGAGTVKVSTAQTIEIKE